MQFWLGFQVKSDEFQEHLSIEYRIHLYSVQIRQILSEFA